MEIVFGFLMPALVLGGGVGFAVKTVHDRARRIEENWAAVARHFGLEYAPASFGHTGRMQGSVRGVSVHVAAAKHNDQTVTEIFVQYPSSGPEVRLTRQLPVPKLFRFMTGRRDLHLNDPVFDPQVTVDGADELAVGRFLTPARRMAVLSLLSNWRDAEITNRSIRVGAPGLVEDANRLAGAILIVIDTALVMSAPDAVDHALLMEQQGDLRAAAMELHTINENQNNTLTQLFEAEALVASGERDEAAAILEAVENAAPGVPEVAGWSELAHTPMPPPLPPTAAPTPSPEAAATATAPGAGPTGPISESELVDDLFGTSRAGHEVEERFSLAYRGRQVTWTGTVEAVREFRSDADFGTTPGTKVTVHIGTLGDGRLVTNQVHAVVHLPADAPLERGAEVRFTGTLVRVDRYMRNVFVGDASIV